MKVAIVQPFLNQTGGVERVVLKMAQHYNAPIYVVDYDKDKTFPDFQKMDVRLIPVPKWINFFKFLPYRAFAGLKYGVAFYFYKFKENYDYIIANYPPSEWSAIRNKNVVWYCHSPLRDAYDLYEYRQKNRMKTDRLYFKILVSIFRFIDKLAVHKIKIIVSNSKNVQKRIEKYFKRESEVIYPCVDPEKYRNDGDGKYFLYVSRFVPSKRQEYVVHIFERFHNLYDSNGEYKLILAGGTSADPESTRYLEELKKFVKDNPLIKIIENPKDDEVINLYSNCSAFLFTGLDEDFGIVPLEAMASGKPIISVDEGGPREYIKNEQNGFLAPTIEKFVEYMELIKSRSLYAENIGKNAKNTIIKMFSWDGFLNKLDNMLK